MDLLDQIKPWLDWLHNHPGLACLATFIISCTESIAVIGLIIPGTIMMTAVGILIGSGVINFWQSMLAAILGAIAGDSLSYRLGYHFKERIPTVWPFNRYPKFLQTGEEFVSRHGGKSVFLGRFVGPVRPIVPMVAGMLSMKTSRFLISNIISAILWAPFYMLPGILIGYASLELEPAVATRFVLTIVTILIVIGLTAWLFKIIIYTILHFADRCLDKLWAFMKNHRSTRPLCLMLADPRNPQGHGQLTLAIFCCLFFLMFITLTSLVISGDHLLTIKLSVYNLFQSFDYPKLLMLNILITFFGAKTNIVITSLITITFLLCCKRPRAALHFVILLIVTLGSIWLLKHMVNSPRPGILSFEKNSFPSGHTTLSLAMYGFLSVLLCRNLSKAWCVTIYTATIILCSAIMISRFYLSMHWITDILGGCLLGLTLLCIVTISYRRLKTRRIPEIWTALIFFTAMGTCVGLQQYRSFANLVDKYSPVSHDKIISMQHWWRTDNSTIPIFRITRTAKPIQLFNIQWAGFQDNIVKNLTEVGWQVLPEMSIATAINSITAGEEDQYLPFIPKYYAGKKPALIMIKDAHVDNVLLVLRLWDSNIKLKNSKLSLFLGTINYQMPRHHHFWKHKSHRAIKQQLPPATRSLESALTAYQWKRATYPLSLQPKKISAQNEWQGGILYIRPKNWPEFSIAGKLLPILLSSYDIFELTEYMQLTALSDSDTLDPSL